MTTKTETIETQYGTVEVETVECDSCGQRIGKEEAHDFTIGDRDGYACSHCVDNGPISFPPSVDVSVKGRPVEMFYSFILLYPLFMLPTIAEVLFGSSEAAKEFFVGSVGAIVWTTLPLLLLLYFGVI